MPLMGSKKIVIHTDERKLSSILILILLVLAVLPVPIFGIVTLIAPRYTMPFLFDPRGGLSLLALSVWDVFGICLFVSEAKKGFHPRLLSKLITTVLVFVWPFVVTIMLGPIVLKIIDHGGSKELPVVAPKKTTESLRQ